VLLQEIRIGIHEAPEQKNPGVRGVAEGAARPGPHGVLSDFNPAVGREIGA